ncbi:MAG: hypothetical protein JWP03_69 [Phycisphaerales bacterium]|nr:hypothetical protein [Phycisphaerales bacterium]
MRSSTLGSRHYGTLTAHERFALLVEAMARRDDREADRLGDTCPRRTYRAEDQAFRERMRLASTIANRVCLNLRAGLAQIRMAKVFCQQAEKFAGPSAFVARAAFLCGREYGRWEAGAIETIGLPDARSLADAVAAQPELREQLQEAREVAEEAMGKVAQTLLEATGELHATDLLSQWEGFGRFCGESLGVDPVTVFRAFGLGHEDPAMEVRSAFPAARTDDTIAVEWARRWSWSWQRRVG